MKKLFVLATTVSAVVSLAACNQAPAPAASANKAAPAPAAPAAPANTAAPAAPGAPAGDSTNQNFSLNNTSATAITHVYVSPVTSEQWGEDILGREILPAGETAAITFPRTESQCNWDIRVTVEGGTNHELRNINLCETTDVNYQ